MTEPAIILTRDLHVAYSRGRIVALSGITCALAEGIIGLVGANGAGKTTLLRCVIGAARTGWNDPSTTMPFIDRYVPLIPELA